MDFLGSTGVAEEVILKTGPCLAVNWFMRDFFRIHNGAGDSPLRAETSKRGRDVARQWLSIIRILRHAISRREHREGPRNWKGGPDVCRLCKTRQRCRRVSSCSGHFFKVAKSAGSL